MSTNNSIQPGIRVRDWDFDAFYLDEFSPAVTQVNPTTQCRLSKFTELVASGPRFFAGETAEIRDANPLEDSAQVSLVETTTGNPDAGKTDWKYQAFRSVPLRLKTNPTPVKLCLFFGPPGPVLNRQGLRSFFEASEIVPIAIEGIESSPHKFGVGIAPKQINRLLTRLFNSTMLDTSWTIHTLAGYSTGFRGMNRSILELFPDAKLNSVKKVIYYDCLYRHDDPKPAGVASGEHTFHALDKVLRNSPGAKFVVYELTGNVTDTVAGIVGGTPRKSSGGFWTRWPANADPLSKTNTVTEVNNFKPGGALASFQSLACARLIDGGLEDGYFDRAFIKARFGSAGDALLIAIDTQLKGRGTYASNTARATGGKVFIGNWLSPATDSPKFAPLLESMRRPVIDHFDLLGWDPTGSTGDIAHDSHVPEFGWEHLLG